MASVVPVCTGVMTVTRIGDLRCDVAWQTIATPAFFDFSKIDPAIMGQAVGAGFFIGAFALATAWGMRQLYKLIMGK